MTTLEAKRGGRKVGRFSVEIELANHEDAILAKKGVIPSSKIRRVTVLGLVDAGASRLVLPQRIVKELGLEPSGSVKVKYADGRQMVRPTVDDVEVELLGRRSVFSASVEPRRQTALIGALILEDLDFLVDPLKMKLVPRDPKMIVSEAE
jgi:predicted aspartyl protease